MLRSLFPKTLSPFSSFKEKHRLCPVPADLVSLLNLCSHLKHIHQTHGFMVSRGLDQDNLLVSRFIDACSALGFSCYGYAFFTHKTHPDIYLCNTVIRAFAHSARDAILIFNRIQESGLRPDTYTLPFLLKSVVRLSALEVGRQIHCHAIGMGLDLDIHAVTALIQMYASCECISDAQKLFDGVSFRSVTFWNAMVVGYVKVGDVDRAHLLFERMPHRNVISWTALIAGYSQMNRSTDAIAIFWRMLHEGVMPDEITMLVALSACAHIGTLELGVWIHHYMGKHGLFKSTPLYNALIDMYAKSGNINKALDVFENMKHRTVVTWTTIIYGLALHGLGGEALEMFSRMERAKVKPNEVTFIAILSACSHAGLVEIGLQYFNSMDLRYGIKPTIEHYGCIIDLLGRAGFLQTAQKLAREMPFEASAAVWGSLLTASRIHADPELAEHALQHLTRVESHNSGNYMILSNIYAAAGRWGEVGLARRAMRDTGVKKPPGGSSIEVNNRVHEFKAGDKSHPQYERMYEVLHKVNWHLKMITCM